MIVLLAWCLGAGGPVVLRERAEVAGRYVPLSRLVAGELPAPLAGVWLGRSPEPGGTRRITADRIRRELAWRGIEVELEGETVDVVRVSGGGTPPAPVAAPAEPEPEPSGPVVVKRGEIVRAVAGGFDVDARALKGGRLGETVDVEFVGSRNRCRARVAGPGRAVVLEDEE